MITDGLRALATPAGRFGMVALDQRESLPTLLSRADRPAGDADLHAFKAVAVRVLSPHASAVLLDRPFGLTAAGTPVATPAPYCGLILAVDDFVQPAGQPVRASELDPLAADQRRAGRTLGGAVHGVERRASWPAAGSGSEAARADDWDAALATTADDWDAALATTAVARLRRLLDVVG